MHIPDGILSVSVSAGCYAASAVALAASGRKAGKEFEDRLTPLAGVTGAFIFAAQMVNIPIPGGTSGHLVGGALLSLVLGLAPAVLVMAAVVVTQCLIFQDGGLLAMGANLLNMAITGPTAGFLTFRAATLVLPARWALPVGAFAAGWLSVEAGALMAGLQMGLSGTLPLKTATVAMGSVHAVIGIIEGTVTLAVTQMIQARRPDLLFVNSEKPEPRDGAWSRDGALIALSAAALLLATVVALFASQAPDGLERVLSSHGVKEGKGWLEAPLPDYTLPWLRGWVGKSLAGLLGVAGTTGLILISVRLLRRRRERSGN